jgi:hypothetical protein
VVSKANNPNRFQAGLWRPILRNPKVIPVGSSIIYGPSARLPLISLKKIGFVLPNPEFLPPLLFEIPARARGGAIHPGREAGFFGSGPTLQTANGFVLPNGHNCNYGCYNYNILLKVVKSQTGNRMRTAIGRILVADQSVRRDPAVKL